MEADLTSDLTSKVVFLVLAAGFSRRFSSSEAASNLQRNKLEVTLTDGKSILQQTLETLQSLSSSIYVVTNKEVPSTRALLVDNKLISSNIVECASQGLGESIACGVAASEHAAGWVLCLADMPFISREIYLQVLGEISAHPQNIIRPRWNRQDGHPVYFPQRFFAELCALSDDKGAKKLIERHNEAALYFDVDDACVIQDIDTVTDLIKFNRIKQDG